MALRSLLNMPVTVRRRGVSGTDDHGNPVEVDVEVFETVAFIDTAPMSQDATGDGMAQIATSSALLVIDGESMIADGDRVEDSDGMVWVVDGRPAKVWSPRMGQTHHLEAKLTLAE